MTEDHLFHHHSISATITLLALSPSLLLFSLNQVSGQSTPTLELVQAPIGATSTPSMASKTFMLDYTGALYGYYRIEEPDHAAGKLEPPITFLHHDWKTPPLLFGVGDNFGPEFGASIQQDHVKLPVDETGEKFTESLECYLVATQPTPGHKAVPPEIYYKDDNRLPKMAECDNVGRFLMWAGYRAIVPGKEDFLYSARWLRRMALLFRAASDPNKYDPAFLDDGGKTNPYILRGKITSPDHRIHMLASNLRLNFTVEGFDLRPDGIKEKEKIAKALSGMCPLLFSWDPLGSLATANGQEHGEPESCVSGGSTGGTVTKEMDWLRRLDLTVDDANIAASMNEQAKADVIFRRQLLENQVQIVSATLSSAVCGNTCADMQKRWPVRG
jgi:hypothetical protein